VVIESTVGNAVHIQTLYFYAGLLVVLGRYCIIISSYCIFTAKDNNIDLFALLLSVIMVVVARLLLFSRASDAGDGDCILWNC
jgi:predicted permease